MEFIEGHNLETSWNNYDPAAKRQIAAQLKEYIEQLRSIPAADYIGSVDRGPVTDIILEWSSPIKGWFTQFVSCILMLACVATQMGINILLRPVRQ